MLLLWSIARYDLGVSEAEFWGMTPRTLDALLGRRAIEQQMQDYRAGLIAMLVHNAHAKSAKSIADFFPSLKTGPREQTPEEMLAVAEQLNQLFGGEDLRQK